MTESFHIGVNPKSLKVRMWNSKDVLGIWQIEEECNYIAYIQSNSTKLMKQNN